nr:MAG TPA: hypothetical protein [Caudoviricetes sp.]
MGSKVGYTLFLMQAIGYFIEWRGVYCSAF